MKAAVSLPAELSVVLPSYLEEENLRLILPRIKKSLDSLGIAWEILVVDTEKPLDFTQEACSLYGARYLNRRGGNLYGDAVRTGIEEARGSSILFMDADGSHTPEFIPTLFSFRKDYDVVIASRYVNGGFTENSLLLIFMSRVLNLTYALVLNLKCKDVSNSFKLYRAAPLKKLILCCDHFDIIEEILFKLKRSLPELKIKETPFSFKKRIFGETKRNLVLFMATYFITIIKLRFSHLPFFRKKDRARLISAQSHNGGLESKAHLFRPD